MPVYTPFNQQLKRLECPICGTVKMVHPLAETCSQRCSQRRARQRRAQRDGTAALSASSAVVDTRVLDTLVNPTIAELEQRALALAGFDPATKVFVLKGSIPVVENALVGDATVIRDTKGEWLLLRLQ